MATVDQHRRASGLVAGVSAAIAAWLDGLPSGLAVLLGLSLPAVLIWFAEPLGGFVGQIGFRRIHRESPPGLIRALGWIGLLVLALAVLAGLSRRSATG